MEGESVREEINRPWARSMVASVAKLEASSGRERFLVWKADVKRILQRAGLWDVVDPDQNEDSHGVSPDAVSKPHIRQWRSEARDIIQSAVAFEIECNSDPRECWIYLQKTLAPNTAVQRYEYLRRLWNLRMREVEKALAFRSRVQHVLDHLQDMGVVANEQLLVLLLIDALPRSWTLAASAYRREAQIGRTMQTMGELFMAMRRREIHIETRAQARGLDQVIPRQEV